MTFKGLITGDKGKKITIIGAAVILVLLMLSSVFGSKKQNTAVSSVELSDAAEIAEIEKSLEKRLENLIAKIDGAGEVSVMVTLDRSAQVIYEQNRKTQDNLSENSDGKNENTAYEKETVLAGSSKQPLQIGTQQPKVRGAAVVCGGAADPVIREKIIYTVSKALNIGVSRVYVTS